MTEEILMQIDEANQAAVRVMERCDLLGTLSEVNGMLSRFYLSSKHLRVNQCVAKWMEEAGMRVWQDAVGNICGRYEALILGSPAILLGSHLDTVCNAGRYDGVLGVLSAIEIVQWLYNHKYRFSFAIEIIGFGDEEGVRFGIAFLGSLGLVGAWNKKWLRCSDSDGVTIAKAMENFGMDSSKFFAAERNSDEILAYLELHIEQGSFLEEENLRLGVVSCISGSRRLNCCFVGQAGHAGSSMKNRRDALVAASEWIIFIERIVEKSGSDLLATVGSLTCIPGVVNVIPEKVNILLDVRGSKDFTLEKFLSELINKAEDIACKRGLSFEFFEYHRVFSVVCDRKLQEILMKSIKLVQGKSVELISRAGHDAVIISRRWPIGMLFVRNHRGISHHPLESVKQKDVAYAIRTYLQALYQFSVM